MLFAPTSVPRCMWQRVYLYMTEHVQQWADEQQARVCQRLTIATLPSFSLVTGEYAHAVSQAAWSRA